jgi:hypothetical protein
MGSAGQQANAYSFTGLIKEATPYAEEALRRGRIAARLMPPGELEKGLASCGPSFAAGVSAFLSNATTSAHSWVHAFCSCAGSVARAAPSRRPARSVSCWPVLWCKTARPGLRALRPTRPAKRFSFFGPFGGRW